MGFNLSKYIPDDEDESDNQDNKILSFIYKVDDLGDYIFYDLIAEDLRKSNLRTGEFILKSNLNQRTIDDMRKIKHQSKNTIIAAAIGLGYNLEKTQALLNKCGYHLSENIMYDKVIISFFNNGIKDIGTINDKLYDLGLTILGTKHRD